MDRRLDPAGLMAIPTELIELGTTWSDYDGDDAYGEFTLSGATATTQAYYEPGLWRNTKLGSTFVPLYLHNDHLGTLRRTTTAIGAATSGSRVFTAFGEKLTAPADRFGYAGAWGYQAHAEMPFLHVGHCYYDPASGRFLQRDPIGIAGHLGVYTYTRSRPTYSVDPNGLFDTEAAIVGGFVGLCVGLWQGGPVGAAVGAGAGAITGGWESGDANSVWEEIKEAVDDYSDRRGIPDPGKPPEPKLPWPPGPGGGAVFEPNWCTRPGAGPCPR